MTRPPHRAARACPESTLSALDSVRAYLSERLSSFVTDAEFYARLCAFELQPLPGVTSDKRPQNIEPSEPEVMPGKWLHHNFERERNARYRWHVGGAE